MSDDSDLVEEMKPSPVSVAVAHGILLAINLLVLSFVVPVFGEMFADFGAELPSPTQYLLDISCLARSGFGFGVAVLFLGADAYIYYLLYRYVHRDVALAWFWLLLLIIALNIPLLIYGMFLPIIRIGEVVSTS